MSGLGGIYNFDGAPIDEQVLSALGAGLDFQGPDGGMEIVSTSVGMAYRALYTNRESLQEKQPLITTSGYILTLDGRLDNRDDLIRQLRDLLVNPSIGLNSEVGNKGLTGANSQY